MMIRFGNSFQRKGIEAFCKQTDDPEATLTRLEQTWESGTLTKTCRVDDEYIISVRPWGVRVIPLQEVVFAEYTWQRRHLGAVLFGMLGSLLFPKAWKLHFYNKNMTMPDCFVPVPCMPALNTHMANNRIPIYYIGRAGSSLNPDDLDEYWTFPDDYIAYVRRSRGRGGKRSFEANQGIVSVDFKYITVLQGNIDGYYIAEARVKAIEGEDGTELYKASYATLEEVQTMVTDFVERQIEPNLSDWVYVPEK